MALTSTPVSSRSVGADEIQKDDFGVVQVHASTDESDISGLDTAYQSVGCFVALPAPCEARCIVRMAAQSQDGSIFS